MNQDVIYKLEALHDIPKYEGFCPTGDLGFLEHDWLEAHFRQTAPDLPGLKRRGYARLEASGSNWASPQL